MAISTQKTQTQEQDVHIQQITECTRRSLVPKIITEFTSQLESSTIGGLYVFQNFDVTAAKRLIVLIPNLDVDEVAVAHEIWNLAFPPGLAVILLSLCFNLNDEPRARRRLATMASLVREPRVAVEIQLNFGRNWMKSLRNVLNPGDIVVCPADYQIGILHKPLDASLAKLGIPVITLSQVYVESDRRFPDFLREPIFWAVSLTIISVFFWLQIRITQISEEWARNILLYLSVPLEVGLLWIWHNLISQAN